MFFFGKTNKNTNRNGKNSMNLNERQQEILKELGIHIVEIDFVKEITIITGRNGDKVYIDDIYKGDVAVRALVTNTHKAYFIYRDWEQETE